MPLVAYDGEATIPTTKLWGEAFQQTQTLEMAKVSGGLASISTEMKGAILNGIYSSSKITINDTLPTCTTGNCTFPVYQSLAVCATTADVTPHLQNMTTKEEMKWCLPGGFCASTNFSGKLGQPSITTMATIASAVTQANNSAARASRPRSSLNYTSLAFANHPAPIADFYLIYYNFTKSGPIVEQPWAAVEFTLDWCVPTFSTSVTNGTATTSRLPDPFMAFDATHGYYVRARPAGEDIAIFSDTHATLQRYLNLTLSGSAYWSEQDSYTDSDAVQMLCSFFGIGGQGTDLNSTLVDGIAALQDMLANTATSMTNYMRSRSNLDVVNGIAYVQQNVVRVRWAWIAAPIIFSAASLLFFVAVVVLCSIRRAGKPPLWKSSAVATLRCLDPGLHGELGGAPGKISVCGHDGGKSVRLLRNGDGWLLAPILSDK
jgi:hypothetical protein